MLFRSRADELKAQLFAVMQEAEETKLETVNGKAVIVDTRDFDLGAFPEVAEAEAAAKALKDKAKETAPFTVKQTLRFTPNRGFEPPAPKTNKVWKTRIVTAPALA